jgi:adenosylhomocysteine nucleosidase
MKKKKQLCGVIVADTMEFQPYIDYALGRGCELESFHGLDLLRFDLGSEAQALEIYVVRCGIGLVNAAAATAFLVSGGADFVINSGLSGALTGRGRSSFVIGQRFVQHDFDLTPLGYQPAQKPRQETVFDADVRLISAFSKFLPEAAKGTLVSGDRFIADKAEAERLARDFGALAVDMESAACASVCRRSGGVPFVALRQISDHANGNAPETYVEMNDRAQPTLCEAVLKVLETFRL